MKAIRYHSYGGPEVLALEDVPTPTPKEDEVRIRVRAAGVNPRDWHLMRGLPSVMRLQFGLRAPKNGGLGGDVAGEVEAVGSRVRRFKPGDAVYADIETHGFAQYVCAKEEVVALKPDGLSFEEAAAIPLAATTALQGLRDVAHVERGQNVLIVGAGGGIGIFAVPLAKWMGAEVTGVCSASKAELVRGLGADHVIDYARDDFTRASTKYDVILQLAGRQSPSQCRKALTPKGTLLQSSGESDGKLLGPLDRIIAGLVLNPFVSQHIVSYLAKAKGDDLRTIASLVEDGTLRVVIDRTYPLAKTGEAVAYVEQGHSTGKVVVTID